MIPNQQEPTKYKAFLKRTLKMKDKEPVEELLPFESKSQLYKFLRGGTTLSSMAKSDLLRHKSIEFQMKDGLTIVLEVSYVE